MASDLYESLVAHLPGNELVKNVLILGSAPAAPTAAGLIGKQTIVVALNNAWQALPRVDVSFYAGDFPAARRHPQAGRLGRSAAQYVPAIRQFGGIVYCGATIAFAAAYWAMLNFPCAQVSFYGCDMVYPPGESHFYGQGSADPLRRNLSLQTLEAKAARIFYFGLLQDVLFLNASSQAETRLCLPRVRSGISLSVTLFAQVRREMLLLRDRLQPLAQAALALEASNVIDPLRPDYWVYANDPAIWAHTLQVDGLWLALRDEIRVFEAQLLQVAGSVTG